MINVHVFKAAQAPRAYFLQLFFYAVAVTMWTLQLVTMIPIFVIGVVVMNGFNTATTQKIDLFCRYHRRVNESY